MMMHIRTNQAVVVLFILIGLSQLGFAQHKTPASPDKDALLRWIRFGYRELNLPPRLQNDDLRLKNHLLDNDIARLEGQDMDLVRTTIDRYVIDQDKIAIKVANWFAQAWSSTGNTDLQLKLFDVEGRFDDAIEQCRPDSSGDAEDAVTLEEVEGRCRNLHDIELAVRQYGIKVSVPPPTVFKHTNTLMTGEKLLRADKMRLALDMATHRPTRINKLLIDGDQRLIGLDKLIWLLELSYENTVKSNKAHPETPVAIDLDLVTSTTNLRQQVSDLENDTRQKLLNIKTQ
jgi:hypothetical protein